MTKRGVFALIAFAVVLFASPLFQRTFPEQADNPVVGAAAVMLLAVPSFIAAWQWLGSKRALLLLASLSLFAFIIETVGLQTGYPYSAFTYGSGLGPLLPGGAPFSLPFAYVPLVLGALWVTWRLRAKPVLFTCAFASSLLAVDLVLDPGAVVLGLWTYVRGGLYYGVPWLNFVGWLISGALAGGLTLMLLRSQKQSPSPLLAVSMLLHFVYWTGVAFWYALSVPFAIGALLILLLSYLLYRAAYGRLF